MHTVSYTYYNKYTHEKSFFSYEDAKKFFWYIQRKAGVTSVKLG
jgi:hypothetical protein